jgi:uncharacterized protein (UPF0261 family)
VAERARDLVVIFLASLVTGLRRLPRYGLHRALSAISGYVERPRNDAAESAEAEVMNSLLQAEFPQNVFVRDC